MYEYFEEGLGKNEEIQFIQHIRDDLLLEGNGKYWILIEGINKDIHTSFGVRVCVKTDTCVRNIFCWDDSYKKINR